MAKRNPHAAKVNSASIPAPVGGLNARDSVAEMPETDALILDNWFPTPTSIQVRGGSDRHALTLGGLLGNNIETLMAYNGPATQNLFAIDSAGIADVTAGNNLSPSVTGLSNSRFQYVNFGTSGGHFLLAVNGADKLRGYTGSAWYADGDGSHDITGVDTSAIIQINIWKNRVWMTEKDSTKAWYLPVNAIAGAAVSFDLGSLFRLGGHLMGIVTWTLNTQNGTDEVIVFVSSEGECIVYQGYDPSSASSFAQAGHFRIGRPIGRRFFCKAGADILMITADGIIPLSQAMLTDRSQLRIALSDKIVNLISNDVKSYANNFGWQIILHPIGNKIVVNTPKVENSTQYQYVMNTITGAWCTFGMVNTTSAWSADCFELFNDVLYFAGSTGGVAYKAVFAADTGAADFGSIEIFATAKPAFSYFKEPGVQKLFTMARPILALEGSIQAAISMNVDFNETIPNVNYISVGSATSSPWDTSPWDVTPWGSDSTIIRNWQTTNGLGFSGCISMTTATTIALAWQSTDYVYQRGGIL